MLKIRLARVGKRKKPTYRFIINESTKDTYGKALEILGHYDPFQKIIEIKKDRVLHWISQGAKLSPTVHNIFVDQNVIEAEKVRASKSKKKKVEEATAPQAKAEGEASAETSEVKESPTEEVKTPESPAPEDKKEEVKTQEPEESKEEK